MYEDSVCENEGTVFGVLQDSVLVFFKSTSVGGLSHAGATKIRISRWIWFILFIVGIVLTFYDGQNVVNSYFTYPYSTQVDIEHKTMVTFPAVTVCNQNRIHCSKILNMTLTSLVNKDNRAKNFFDLYSVSLCGLRTIGCNKTIDEYFKFGLTAYNVPDYVIKDDYCVSCPELFRKFLVICESDTTNQVKNTYIQFLNSFWQEEKCTDLHDDKAEMAVIMSMLNQFASITVSKCPTVDELLYYLSEVKKVYSKNALSPSMPTLPASNLPPAPLPLNKYLPNDSIVNLDIINIPHGGETKMKSLNDAHSHVIRKRSTFRDLGDVLGKMVLNIQNKKNMVYDPEVSNHFNLQMKFLIYYHNLTYEERKIIGYDLEELVVSCEFSGLKCNIERDFVHFINPLYGNCYTYNSMGDKVTGYTTSLFSLLLTLRIQPKSYLPELLTIKQGARVSIHDYSVTPNIPDDGFDVNSNQFTSFALMKVSTYYLPKPFKSKCINSWNETQYELELEELQTYTPWICNSVCGERLVEDQCGCMNPIYSTVFKYDGLQYAAPPTPICNLTMNSKDYNCLASVLQNLDVVSRECQICRLPCHETTYETSKTTSDWPPDIAKESVVGHFGYNADETLALAVHYRKLSVKQISQVPKFKTTSDLVSAVGGTFGVYLGISMILLVELIEFFVKLFYNLFLYSLGKYSRPQTLKSNNNNNKSCGHHCYLHYDPTRVEAIINRKVFLS